MTTLLNSYQQLVSLENLFFCYDQFKRGKGKSKDIPSFFRHLEDEIFSLQEELIKENYHHGPYKKFTVFDPKKRKISKASVRDRLVHHALYNRLVYLFDPLFFEHSYACRVGKGTHMAVSNLKKMVQKVSRNGASSCYGLKMDIFRFFDHVDHALLKKNIQRKIKDESVLNLTFSVIDSFTHHLEGGKPVGLPLGNVTSQVFANIYLHELDRFIKHHLREKHYLRFSDDLLLLGTDRSHLEQVSQEIKVFLEEKLFLKIHPHKKTIRSIHQGIDFLGYVIFSKHTLVRTATKNRIKNGLESAFSDFLDGAIAGEILDQKLQSYLGILYHANEKKLSMALINAYWVRHRIAS